jgi:hypothetical protein
VKRGSNAVAAAPDGTSWAVGADGAENGGPYRLPDLTATLSPLLAPTG